MVNGTGFINQAPSICTATNPERAPAGTVNCTSVEVIRVTVAATPFNCACETVPKFSPTRVTVVPGGPDTGVILWSATWARVVHAERPREAVARENIFRLAHQVIKSGVFAFMTRPGLLEAMKALSEFSFGGQISQVVGGRIRVFHGRLGA